MRTYPWMTQWVQVMQPLPLCWTKATNAPAVSTI